ncbi:MAG: hypothetical protein V4556_10985 [Bacteroidota bacterium]
MKKKFLPVLFFSFLTIQSFAQVGIGTNTPNTSSILDLSSTNKALLLPRMTTQQRDLIPNPVAGMEIFNTITTCIEIYRGASWYNLCSGTTPSTNGPNLVQGGDMSDASKWTNYPIYAGVTASISGGVAKWTGGEATPSAGGGHYGIYQAITVEAGKNYEIDMHVKGANINNVWFEVYISATAPTNGIEYNFGGKRLSLNTWDCASTNKTFDAQLSSISCAGNGKNITFASSGTVYLMIRCGGDDLTTTGGTGVSVDDVDFHSTN